jgi:hypothetical protein
LDGVTSAIQTQINSKQATLVSGTNIKTINSTSLLGSGDITISANPSGVAGAIQFSNGSAFASDAANLFWDDINNRLGVGTNAPTSRFQIVTDDAINPQAFSSQTSALAGTASQGALICAFSATNGGFINAVWPGNAWLKMNYGALQHIFSNSGNVNAVIDSNTTFGAGTTSLGARLGIRGSGSTSATTSLLVQNSAGTATLTARDDGKILIRDYISGVGENAYLRLNNSNGFEGGYNEGSGGSFQAGGSTVNLNIGGNKILQGYSGGISIGKGASNPVASAQLEVFSTTKGFLPPVMTTTQKNAIASPASGLVVYDSTTNKLQCYNGSTWNDLF